MIPFLSKSGQQLLIGSMITAGGLYYAYDEFGHCFDEDTFRVTFATGALYAGNADLGSCYYRLPVISAVQDSIGIQPFILQVPVDSGIRYRPGNKIGQTTTLYIYDVSSACSLQDTIQVTRKLRPQLDLKTGFGGCSSAWDADAISLTANLFMPGGMGLFSMQEI